MFCRQCNCKNGYFLVGDENQSCVDIDECSDGSHICDPNAECINTAGGYNCQCLPDFTGNGHECIPSGEPVEEPEVHTDKPYTVSYGSISTTTTEREVPFLSPNDISCEGCSTAAYCEQNICVCHPGYEGDGYECNSVCELDYVWSNGRCILPERQTTTQQSEVVEDESEEFGKRFS